VLFRRQATLLRFMPEDGLHVLVRGRVSVYEQRGQMQLVAETMEPVGAGSLQLAFEQLKERLKAEGLFDAARKRPLPAYPHAVAIVTSPTGAVIRDFMNIVNRRHAGLSIFLYPVMVQGDSAPAEIATAIESLNVAGIVDLIVVARGGGSLEDLAAFNSERVARAIASSGLPIVSAVGHETDFTIADFAADLRAPTPSAAAELITEAQHKIAEHLANTSQRIERAVRFQLLKAHQQLNRVPATRSETRISILLHRYAQRMDDLSFRLESVLTTQVQSGKNRLTDLAAFVLRHDPRQRIAHARGHLNDFSARLARAIERQLQVESSSVGSLDARLHSLSPLAVLDRGYALVIGTDGAIVRSIAQLSPDQAVTTRVADGSFTSRIIDVAVNK
jgi:exodeoxyribonuclease VII large subunit